MTAISTLSPAALRRLHVHRYAGLFRPLEGDERERLRDSMRRGYDPLYPIVISATTREIVDGRNRRDLAVELELEDVPVVEREFADDAEIATYIASVNLARRHLDARERRELAGRLVLNGTSTRQAAKASGVSKNTAQRAAVEARASGVPEGTPARTRGSDGKSYASTSPRGKRSPSPPPPRTAEKPAAPDHRPGYVDSQAVELLEHADRTMNADNIENQLAWDVDEALKAKDEVWLSTARATIAALISRLERLQRVLDDPVERRRARDEINELADRERSRPARLNAEAAPAA